MRETYQPPTSSPAGPPHDHTHPRHSYTHPLHSPRLPTSIPAPTHVIPAPTRVTPTPSRFIPRAYPRHSRTHPRHSREGGNLHLPASHLTKQNPRTILDPWPLHETIAQGNILQSIICNLQSAISNPQCPHPAVDGNRHNPTESYKILRKLVCARTRARQRRSVSLLSEYRCGSAYGVIDKIWSMGLYYNHQRPSRRALP